MMQELLPRRALAEIIASRPAMLDLETVTKASAIVDDVRSRGVLALLEYAAEFDSWGPSKPWWFGTADLEQARDQLDPQVRRDLEAMRDQIASFATAQRDTISTLDVAVPGGRAGHHIVPVARAGCYVPAGRFPLPSSLLMGVVTAKVAGVGEVWVASPHPSDVMLAASAIAGASGLIAVGGAQAIGALAFGADPVPACDVVVGPGNRWVTAGKYAIAGRVGIDFLAGPSELVILADETASPQRVAADLLAQAEHDPEAWPILVTTDERLVDAVNEALQQQLSTLPAANIARQALRNGGALVYPSIADAIKAVNALAPEHLQLSVSQPDILVAAVEHAGAIFVGESSAEVFGDYGLGPNHVLPTGQGARFTAGLSVMTFLRLRTWLRIDAAGSIAARTARLARLEGLEGHARAAESRT